jgi:hypothetical protein
VGQYDTREPLIIDPILAYSTYLAGSLKDGAFAIAVDASGNAYVTGDTNSADFPTTAGAFDTVCGSDGTCNVAGSHGADNSNTDVFVTKLSANGSSLVYSTYLGGALQEGGRGIAVDANGNAYVTGFTISEVAPVSWTPPGLGDDRRPRCRRPTPRIRWSIGSGSLTWFARADRRNPSRASSSRRRSASATGCARRIAMRVVGPMA